VHFVGRSTLKPVSWICSLLVKSYPVIISNSFLHEANRLYESTRKPSGVPAYDDILAMLQSIQSRRKFS
jgi:hypothetical protein